MAVTVLIPTTLRGFTERKAELSLDGSTVGLVLASLFKQYPETEKILFDEQGALRAFVNVFVNDNNVKQLDGLETKLKDNDEIMLIPAIAGGAPRSSVLPDDRKEKLSNDEILRYSRHLLLKEVGVKGQKRLKAAKVLIAGLGGLGAPLAQYLAAAGVGTIGLLDYDEVDPTNLQRQVIHGTRDVGRPKVASARDKIKLINPKVKTVMINEKLTADNALEIIGDYDVVADATDNYATRYIISDACAILGKPDVFGAMYQFEGQVTVFCDKGGPCYRCVYPAPPPAGLVPSCAESGVLGVLAGIIGSLQANEVIKLIVGGGEVLTGKILCVDAWNLRFRILQACRDPKCPVCGDHPTLTKPEAFDYQELCGLKPKTDEEPVEAIEALELKRRLDAGEEITIVDVREPHERAIVKFPNAKVIPIGQLARRQNELDPNHDTVFICKEGKRSILAIRTLREAGYKGRCFNLKDGINTWARDVDKTLPQY